MLNSVQRPKTLKEIALEQLKESITLGNIKPGERLVERSLCEKMGVSRTVVRECIRHLESERLVTVEPNKGPSVAIMSNEEISEIYAIRTMLESSAIAECALRSDTAITDKLLGYCDKIQADLQHNNILQALHNTQTFYELIFTTAGKHIAWDLVEQLNGRIGRMRVLTLSSQGRDSSGPDSLRAIARAIGEQNPQVAKAACNAHLQEALKLAIGKPVIP